MQRPPMDWDIGAWCVCGAKSMSLVDACVRDVIVAVWSCVRPYVVVRRCVCQTIIRRLHQSATSDPRRNPFIERDQEGACVAHSMASASADSRSPKPEAMGDDMIVPGVVGGSPESELRVDFVSAMHRVLSLSDDDLAALRSTDPSASSPFVQGTLCAVSPVTAVLHTVPHASK